MVFSLPQLHFIAGHASGFVQVVAHQ